MAQELVNTGSERVISGMKPLLLLVGVAAAIAAGVGVDALVRGTRPTACCTPISRPKTPRRSPRRSTAPAFPTSSRTACGSISVPAEQLAAARLKLAAQGLPESGGGVNAMTRDPGFGVSAFMENARYQHALETELARTIASLQNVQGARVHLAMARQSAFVSERRPGSASVFLQIKAGRRLDDENRCRPSRTSWRPAFRSSPASQVTVVDQTGRLLSAPETDSDTRDARQDVRVLAPPRRKLFESHPGDADAARGPGPRARAGGGAGGHDHHRITRANSSIRRARSCAANRPPKKPRAMAPATPVACRAR